MNFGGILSGFAASALLVAITTSAVRPEDRAHSGLELGDVLPEMKEKTERPCSLVQEKSSRRYTLVHFWAAYNGQSRAENIVWDRFFSSTVSDKIAYRALCMDPDREVFAQTLRLDGVAHPDQYYIYPSEHDKVSNEYGLAKRFQTYLIDDLGVVRSVNPTPAELERFYLL